jgi:hypothetical protein
MPGINQTQVQIMKDWICPLMALLPVLFSQLAILFEIPYP